jgi:uncharacterized 2Fe-2S/4Fe-4S cluster protein (DUF4445 family)
MPVLTLILDGECHELVFEPGRSLRDFLDATHYRVRSACLGLGACGLCRIRLLAGDGGGITAAERLQLGDGIAAGLRLACQCRPMGDVTVELMSPATPSAWRSPPPGLIAAAAPPPADRPLPAGIVHPLGVAVDLGTSHLTLAICDLATGRPLALRFGRNPQGRHGADVVTRLLAAEDPAVARELAAEARAAIGAALADAAQREGLDTGRIGRVVVVGNTAMLALLADRNHGLLLQPAYWGEPIDCAPVGAAAWARDWGIAPGAEIEAVAPLAGFVGSDLLAGLAACGLTAGEAPALLVDFGTNSEIALWTGAVLWVTAAAGGPAFEAGAGRCGMPAEAGAVHRVVFDAAGRPHSSILGGDRAAGICGSGLVDLVAGLRWQGVLTATGRFADGRASYALPVDGQTLELGWRDVDALQRAKGAIGAGIAVLCAQAGIAIGDLRRVVAAGMFGRYLDVTNARGIGLLPDLPDGRIELAGNTALAGAMALLSSGAARNAVSRVRAAARFVNLARLPDFDAAFLEHLYLQPMAPER